MIQLFREYHRGLAETETGDLTWKSKTQPLKPVLPEDRIWVPYRPKDDGKTPTGTESGLRRLLALITE